MWNRTQRRCAIPHSIGWGGRLGWGDKAARAMRASRLDPHVGLAFDHSMRYRPPVGRNVSRRFLRVNTFREIFFISAPIESVRDRSPSLRMSAPSYRTTHQWLQTHFKKDLFSSRNFFSIAFAPIRRTCRRVLRSDRRPPATAVKSNRKYFSRGCHFRHRNTRFARKCASFNRHHRCVSGRETCSPKRRSPVDDRASP